jgi:DNA topoisomerase-1
MPKAVFDATAIDVKAGDYTFRANGSVLKFDGWLKIYPSKFQENDLPVVKDGEELNLKELKPEQHFTQPPPRFNEASLIKTLEKEGIGRPSTYAPIISTIQARNYATKDRSRYFHPTEIGMMVNDVLVEHFPNIVDINFTSHFEEALDDIASGKTKWVPVMKEFYEPFAKNLAEKYESVSKEEVTQQEDTGLICDKCGGKMIIKMGRYGKFTACSNFPTCKNILKDGKDKEEPEKTGITCDKCNEGELVIRTGRYGKFMACSRYPKCKNTKKIGPDGQPMERRPRFSKKSQEGAETENQEAKA